jgi:hypothetical protein
MALVLGEQCFRNAGKNNQTMQVSKSEESLLCKSEVVIAEINNTLPSNLFSDEDS